jgi:DNA-binding GntR family transcriptional regulator
VTSPKPQRRLERTKTSAAVVDYIVEQLFEGQLHSGDRIDLDEVSEDLGISRIPVREAVVVLERDGIVSTKYHRGVFVEPFDAESIRDDFEIMGLLSGLAVRRLADKKDPATLDELRRLLSELKKVDPANKSRIGALVSEMMILEHRAGGSRRVRAALRAHSGFLPQAFRFIQDRDHSVTLRFHSHVVRSILAGEGEKAARYRLDDFRDAGRLVVRELERRGVIGPA